LFILDCIFMGLYFHELLIFFICLGTACAIPLIGWGLYVLKVEFDMSSLSHVAAVLIVPVDRLLSRFRVPGGFLHLAGRQIKMTAIKLAFIVSSGFGATTLTLDVGDGVSRSLSYMSLESLSDTQLTYAYIQALEVWLTAIGTAVIFGGLFLVSTGFATLGKLVHRAFNLPLRLTRALATGWLIFFVPDSVLDIGWVGFVAIVDSPYLKGGFEGAFRLIRAYPLLFTAGFNYLSSADPDDDPFETAEISQRDQKLLRQLNSISKVWLAKRPNLLRKWTLRAVEAMNGFRLPEMLDAAYRPPTLESISKTFSILEGLGLSALPGFPDSIGQEAAHNYLAEHSEWGSWYLGSSNYSLGFRKMKTGFFSWVPEGFFPEFPGNIHTSTFTGILEELRSTARYWSGNHNTDVSDKALLDDVFDALWEGTKIQFEASKLTPPEVIYARWEKKFNFGFGFGLFSPDGRIRQITRRQVIKSLGGHGPFLDLWKDVFRVSKLLDMPSPVFTKMENLKLKKALGRSVRTIIGSPFAHHVLTTVFNFEPNHRYAIWDTPMKVGMPINGQNLNRLWESMLSHDHIFAGDMSAFDSTQAPPVLEMVARLRKMGFEHHKDHRQIAELIDVAYNKLLTQPMGFKNFGDIFTKGQGFTTGHSSTSIDNSLALVINYLFAWKVVTGKPAREFWSYNTLANFGDDHILSWDRVFGWSPEAAMVAMSRLGTVMRDEAPGVRKMPSPVDAFKTSSPPDWSLLPFSFLAKKPIPMTPLLETELKRAGVEAKLTFGSVHDKARLLGKIKGMGLRNRVGDSFKEYKVGLAYLALCAHLPDVYTPLANELNIIALRNRALWVALGHKKIPVVPSYNKVVYDWYSGPLIHYGPRESSDLDRDSLESVTEIEGLVLLEAPDSWMVFVSWLANFPTLLSPRYANLPWSDWLQTKLSARVSWPLQLLANSNGYVTDVPAVKNLLNKSPYAFLRADSLVVGHDRFASVLLRHWIYTAYSVVFRKYRSRSFLDSIRFLDSMIINLWFFITGKIVEVVVELDIHLFETMLVLALSYVHAPEGVDFGPTTWNVASPSYALIALLTRLMRSVTPSGSIDYQPFDAAVSLLRADPGRVCVSAPTGVGKSTRMVVRASDTFQGRVIVIVPRRLLVLSVVDYMKATWPSLRIGGSTEGLSPAVGDKIIYTTMQSYLLKPALRDNNDLVILDEAHILEPAYVAGRNFLLANPGIRLILMSATLPSIPGVPVVDVGTVNQFSIVDVKKTVGSFADYLNFATKVTLDRHYSEKALIFVPTKDLQNRLAAKFVGERVCLLNSESPVVDNNARIFISTSVSDAGLTIPDVSFVVSPDVDIHVTYEDVNIYEGIPPTRGVRRSGADQSPTAGYHSLSDSTITQRRGRTGRTTDGVFILVALDGVPVFPYHPSVTDYMRAIGPFSELVLPFLPDDIKDRLPHRLREAAPAFGAIPGWTWTGFQLAFDTWERYLSQGVAVGTWPEFVQTMIRSVMGSPAAAAYLRLANASVPDVTDIVAFVDHSLRREDELAGELFDADR